jgi:peptidoglycan-N-acetylglucosamine deacetylase
MVPAKTPRLVQLLGKGMQFRIETKEPVVYLTFDDGPIPELTPWIAEQLKYWGAKATFFMVGENIIRQPELVKALLDEGHALGNHTHNHLNGFKTPMPVSRHSNLFGHKVNLYFFGHLTGKSVRGSCSS